MTHEWHKIKDTCPHRECFRCHLHYLRLRGMKYWVTALGSVTHMPVKHKASPHIPCVG